jgi:hypothetical protein
MKAEDDRLRRQREENAQRINIAAKEAEAKKANLVAEAERMARRESAQRERLDAARRAEAQRIADAKAEAKRAEEERLRREWQEDVLQKRKDVSFPSKNGPRVKDYDTARDPPGSRPVVKPPQARTEKPFQPLPSFSPPPNNDMASRSSAQDDGTRGGYSSWEDRQGSRDRNEQRGPTRFKENLMKLKRESEPVTRPPNRDPNNDPRNGAPPPNSDPFMVLESEDALREAFDEMSTFGTSQFASSTDRSAEKMDPSRQSDYEGSYFMDVPDGEENEFLQDPDASSPPFPNQEAYANNWSGQGAGPRNLEPKPPMNNGNDWADWAPRTQIPFSRRGPRPSQGGSYLDNLSKPGESSGPSRMNGGDSYLNNLSRQQQQSSPPPQQQQQQQQQQGSEFPERIRAAYRDWCQYYGKPYNEDRLRIFAANFLAVEKYHRETGVSLILNELADMTSEEYQQQRKM